MKRWTTLLIALIALSSCEFGTTLFGGYNNATETSPSMVTVPAGSFQRDSNPANISTITTSFKMSQCEITRAQFVAVMGTDPSNTLVSTGAGDPVQGVSWYDAIAYCNKLSIKEGLTPVYAVSGVDFSTLVYSGVPSSTNSTWDAATANPSASGYRLPTLMEWMWAAMGATSDRSNGYTGAGVNTTGYTKGYAGSTEAGGAQANIASYAWTAENSSLSTHPVASKKPNELGLFDMSGNAWTWCWDWQGVRPSGSLSDFQGPASGSLRVLRGGSWYVNAFMDSLSYDASWNREARGGDLGLRVVRR